MTVTASSRDRLAQIRERTKAARAARRRAQEAVEAARGARDDHAEAVATQVLSQAQHDVQVAEQLEIALISQMAGIGSGSGQSSFLNDPTTVSSLEQLASSSMPIGNLMLGPMLSAEEYASRGGRFAAVEGGSFGSGMMAAAGDLTIPDASRAQRPYGIVPQLYRPTFLLDMIPHAIMDAGSFEFVREGGSLDSGAAETAEGALKPEETGLDLSQDAIVKAVTIAAWKKVRRQELADVSGLATMLNSRLLYLVNRRIEAQIVNGDGVGSNLLGVLNTTGIGSIAYNAATPPSDAILNGMTQVRLSNAEPTAVLMNPTTYAAMLEAKTAGSGERLDSGGAFQSPADALWGVTVIQSSVISASIALIADWSRATVLYIREGANIRVSDADQDDFLRNKCSFLAEARVGLMTAQPSAISVVHLA